MITRVVRPSRSVVLGACITMDASLQEVNHPENLSYWIPARYLTSISILTCLVTTKIASFKSQ